MYEASQQTEECASSPCAHLDLLTGEVDIHHNGLQMQLRWKVSSHYTTLVSVAPFLSPFRRISV